MVLCSNRRKYREGRNTDSCIRQELAALMPMKQTTAAGDFYGKVEKTVACQMFTRTGSSIVEMWLAIGCI